VKRSGILSVASAALAVLAAAPVEARIGVTSVTDGDPLGQPPTQAERILRVGIDVQASERVTTRAGDRAHLVFLDGTSLTIGPNAVLVLDKYAYDPDRKTGEMAVSATRGVLRFVGGAISKNTEVTITTPSASIGIRGGIAIVEVHDGGATTANFLYGDAMRVTGQGVTQVATRSGSQVTVATGAPPARPTVIPPGQLKSHQPLEKATAQGPLPAGNRQPVLPVAGQGVVQVPGGQNVQQVVQPSTGGATAANVAAASPTAQPALPSPAGQGVQVRPTAASISEAFDRSTLTKNNSQLTPKLAAIVPHFRPDSQAQQGRPGQGPGAQGQPGPGGQGQGRGTPQARPAIAKVGPIAPAAVKPPQVMQNLPRIQTQAVRAVTGQTVNNNKSGR